MRGRSRALQNGFPPAAVREEWPLVMEIQVYRVQKVEAKGGIAASRAYGSEMAQEGFCTPILEHKTFVGGKNQSN